MRLYEKQLAAQIRVLQDALPSKLAGRRSTLEEAANRDLTKATARFEEQSERNIQYLTQFLQDPP